MGVARSYNKLIFFFVGWLGKKIGASPIEDKKHET